jgi:hypothetical protein
MRELSHVLRDFFIFLSGSPVSIDPPSFTTKPPLCANRRSGCREVGRGLAHRNLLWKFISCALAGMSSFGIFQLVAMSFCD